MTSLALAGGAAATPHPAHDGDCVHLEAMLRLAGAAGRSASLASALLHEGGSLGAAMALDELRLLRFGVPSAVARNLAAMRSAQVAALRRILDERPLIACLTAAVDYLRAVMAHLAHEELRILFLDSRHRLIRDEVAGIGTVNRCSVHPRELLIRAIDLSACHLVLAHNHPSGALEPSREDLRMTERLVAAAGLFDLRIEDHLIIGRGGHFSFRDAGLLRCWPAGLEPLPPPK